MGDTGLSITMNPLILFYMGSHPDNKGRFLSDILKQDDLWLEVTHDYIQWLFPNKEKSRITPGTPTITKEVMEAFLNDLLLQQHLEASFRRILAFYGLALTENGVNKATDWKHRKSNWFTEDTHNNLRITRILKCLSTLGLKDEARQFHQALVELTSNEPDCGIGETATQFWAEAMQENL